MGPVFENLPNLFNIYQNYRDINLIILELYLEYSFLSHYFGSDVYSFINIFSEILKVIFISHTFIKEIYNKAYFYSQVYANNDRIFNLMNKVVTEKEDNCHQEFLLTLRILTNLLNYRPSQRNLQEFTFEVCLLGLNIILPGISSDLLKFPSICAQ